MTGPDFVAGDWLRWPESRSVIEALQHDDDSRIVARFVGGAVRDGLIGRAVKDVDIATTLVPDAAAVRLAARGIKVVPTGLDHGTVTAVVDGRAFEVTTLRRDVATDGRRATVAFTEDWREDASRRDFTMNAIYADADGRLYDPFDGRADLTAGRVRFIGDAETRIREDALRILRFFRFHAWYGPEQGTAAPDEDGLSACARLAETLRILSAERISAELLRLLEAPDPSPTIRLLARTGILHQVLPEAVLVDRLEGLIALERALKECDALRRLASLLPDGAGDVGGRLRLSKRDQLRLAEIILPRDEIAPSQSGPSFGRRMRSLLYRIGREAFLDHLLLNWASRGLHPKEKRWRELLREAQAWPVPEFPLRGRDALALGANPGPLVGDLMAELELWWASRDFKPTRGDLLERLQRRLDPPSP